MAGTYRELRVAFALLAMQLTERWYCCQTSFTLQLVLFNSDAEAEHMTRPFRVHRSVLLIKPLR
jgi:hypothetical protein